MRTKLCQAALELLAEVGYERVTAVLISERAKVSKGAQTHHFPSKADMLAGAFEHLLEGWKVRRAEFVESHGGRASLDQALRYLWDKVFSRRDYIAAIELMLAARHEEALRERLQGQLATWTVARDDMFRRVAGLDGDLKRTATFLQLNFCVLRGMAIYDSLSARVDDNAAILELWISMAKQHIEQAGRSASKKA